MPEILRNISIQEKIVNLPENMRGWAEEGLELDELKEGDLEDRPLLDHLKSRWAVGGHEAGHEWQAKVEDWFVDGISVIPQGNTLGYTRMSPNPTHSWEKIHTSKIAISIASEASEDILGIYYHGGCGSDRAQARYHAAILDRQGVISEQRSYAYSSINAAGRGYFSRRAWQLVRNGAEAA